MVYVFLADGFEEVEALTPIDYLRRADIPVTTVGVGTSMPKGAHGITVMTDISEDMFYPDDNVEAVVLPGGMPGTLNLGACAAVTDAVKAAVADRRLVGAICAAPSVLGDLGLLEGREATCYPGFESRLTGAAVAGKKVAASGRVITGQALGSAIPFALELIRQLVGEQAADRVQAAICF